MAAILNDAHPGLADLEVTPHVREYRFWHIRMAHDIVRGPQQLITFEATDADEGIITVCDGAMRIRSRDQALSRVEITLS